MNNLNEYSLYKIIFSEGHKIYLWVDPLKTIIFERTISLSGWEKFEDDYFGYVGMTIKEARQNTSFNIKKVYNHKMNDEQLSKGYLIL